MIDLNKIKYFQVVAQEESITKACKKLPISQPALSLQIKALETELGVQLFERIGKTLRLSKAGYDLLERSQALDDWVRETLEVIKSNDSISGVVKIGTYSTVSSLLLLRPISKMLKKFPDLCFKFDFSPHDQIVEKLEKNKIDMAIITKSGGVLKEESYFKAAYIPVISSHLNYSKETPWVIFPRDEDFIRARGYYDKLIKSKNIVVESVDLKTLRELCIAGAGATILPNFMVAKDLESGKLKEIPTNKKNCPETLYLYSNLKRKPPREISVVLENIKTLRD